MTFIAHLKQHIILYGLGALFTVFVVGGSLYLALQNGGSDELIPVVRDDVVRTVRFSGTVMAEQKRDLSTEVNGVVAAIPIHVGDQVKQGDTLVQLEESRTAALLAQAQAEFIAEEAELAKLVRGARSEEIIIAENTVVQAEAATSDAKEELLDTLRSAYTSADDALTNKSDQFFTSGRTSAPQLAIGTFGFTHLPSERGALNDVMSVWRSSLDELTVDSDLDVAKQDALARLRRIRLFLIDLSSIVSRQVPSGSLTQGAIDSQNSLMTTARTNVDTAISNLNEAQETLNTKSTNLILKQNDLTLLLAGTSDEELSRQRAVVAAKRAARDRYQVELDQTRITAPIGGVVASLDIEIGEAVVAYQPLVSVLSDSGSFEIDANVSELDIVGIEVGATAEVTLDAYDDEVVLSATVAQVDPGETIINDVSTYGVTLLLSASNNIRIRSGMTANVEIETDRRENVLTIPARALLRKDGKAAVNVMREGKRVLVPIELGLRGSGGIVEVRAGLTEGDLVIISSGS